MRVLHRSDMNKYTFITSASHAHFTPIIRAFCLIPQFLLCIYGKLQIFVCQKMQSGLQAPELSLLLTWELTVYETKAIERELLICTDQNVPRGMSPYLTTVKCHLCSPPPLVPKSPTQQMPNELPPAAVTCLSATVSVLVTAKVTQSV